MARELACHAVSPEEFVHSLWTTFRLPLPVDGAPEKIAGTWKLLAHPVGYQENRDMRHWPLFDLRVTTPRLSLRIPTPGQLDELADLAYEGVHDPARMPFLVPWTDAEPVERARGTVQYHWRTWGEWTAEQWSCNFVTLVDGQVIGTQRLGARSFGISREVDTGSWLGRRYHGQGIGTEMRAAVLYLAFAGLGAEVALSGAFSDNPASLAVSHKLGYRPNGEKRLAIRGALATEHRLRLTRADWEARRSVPVTIEGLEPCLSLFGADQG